MTFVEHGLRRSIREAIGVLDAGDVGDVNGAQQMLVSDVADPDAADQAFVARSHEST